MSKLLLGFMLLCLPCVQGVAAQEAPADKPAAQPTTTQVKALDKAMAVVKGAVRADRLDLETTVVTGNRELPKVLYIVPWKKADLGELPAQPFNTLLDEVLQPVDRDVFRREVKYFHAANVGVASGAVKSGAVPPPVSGQ